MVVMQVDPVALLSDEKSLIKKTHFGAVDGPVGVVVRLGFAFCLHVSRGWRAVGIETLLDLIPVDAVPETGQVFLLTHDTVIVEPGVLVDADVEQRVELFADLIRDAKATKERFSGTRWAFGRCC